MNGRLCLGLATFSSSSSPVRSVRKQRVTMTDRVTMKIFEKELKGLIPRDTLISVRSDQPLSAQNHDSWFPSMKVKIRQFGLLFILEEDLDDGLWNLHTFKHFHGILRDQIIENVAPDLREQVRELETAG